MVEELELCDLVVEDLDLRVALAKLKLKLHDLTVLGGDGGVQRGYLLLCV